MFKTGIAVSLKLVYRDGTVEEGLRRGRPRANWVEQCAAQACRWVQELPSLPFSRHCKFLFAFVESFTGWLYVVHIGVGSWGCQRAGNTSYRPATVFTHTQSKLTVSVLGRMACRCIKIILSSEEIAASVLGLVRRTRIGSGHSWPGWSSACRLDELSPQFLRHIKEFKSVSSPVPSTPRVC